MICLSRFFCKSNEDFNVRFIKCNKVLSKHFTNSFLNIIQFGLENITKKNEYLRNIVSFFHSTIGVSVRKEFIKIFHSLKI